MPAIEDGVMAAIFNRPKPNGSAAPWLITG
jgi:hypothetical protein